jgi:hypothetical protein
VQGDDLAEMKRMKRRDFLVGSMVGSTGVLGLMTSVLSRAATPCPPAELSIEGGSSVTTSCSATKLDELAASLAPGQSSTSLGDSGMSSLARYTIQWSNRFHVDVAHGRAHLLGKNASSQGSERSNNLYNIASNQWTSSVFGGDETGHVYESIGYDPARGELYTGQWNGGRTLKRWALNNPLSSWSDPATSNFSDSINTSTQPAVCWHPNLFGAGDGGILALKNEGSTSGVVIAWRRSTNTWHTIAGTSFSGMSGSYIANGSIEYIAAGNYCIATFPPGQGGKTFRINGGSGGNPGAATQIANVPIHCGYVGQGNVGMLFDDPAGRDTAYILEKGGSNRVWKYSGGGWVLKSYKHPFPAGVPTSECRWVAATCRGLGVFWSQAQATNTPSMLWRPND